MKASYTTASFTASSQYFGDFKCRQIERACINFTGSCRRRFPAPCVVFSANDIGGGLFRCKSSKHVLWSSTARATCMGARSGTTLLHHRRNFSLEGCVGTHTLYDKRWHNGMARNRWWCEFTSTPANSDAVSTNPTHCSIPRSCANLPNVVLPNSKMFPTNNALNDAMEHVRTESHVSSAMGVINE